MVQSRGNSGRNSYGFCLRDYKGDHIFAQLEEIQKVTKATIQSERYQLTMWLGN